MVAADGLKDALLSEAERRLSEGKVETDARAGTGATFHEAEGDFDLRPVRPRGCCADSPLKRWGWRHCCCLAAVFVTALATTVLVFYVRLRREEPFMLPPPPPGLILPPSPMAAPTLGNQLISYLSVDWVPPALDGGAAIVNYVVLRAPTAEGDYTVAATLVSSARSVGIGELGASTQVCFRLMAENNGGRSNASESIPTEILCCCFRYRIIFAYPV